MDNKNEQSSGSVNEVTRKKESHEGSDVSKYAPGVRSAQEAQTSSAQGSDINPERDDELAEVLKSGDDNTSVKETDNRKAPIWWDISIGVCFVLVGLLGYFSYEQSQLLPDTPLKSLEKEYQDLKVAYDETRLLYMDVKMKDVKEKALLQGVNDLYDLKNSLAQKNQQIGELQSEIEALNAQMKSYFELYKKFAREQARKLTFDSITTVNTKRTYLDVSIMRVTDDSVRIVHAGGATNLSPSDLTEPLQNRLAFGDPLELKLLEEEQIKDNDEKQKINAALPSSGNVVPAGVNNNAGSHGGQPIPDADSAPQSQLPSSAANPVDTKK